MRPALALIIAAGLAAGVSVVASADTNNARAALDRITPAEWSSNYSTLLTSVMEHTTRGAPGARLLKLEGGGHELHPGQWDRIGEAIVNHTSIRRQS